MIPFVTEVTPTYKIDLLIDLKPSEGCRSWLTNHKGLNYTCIKYRVAAQLNGYRCNILLLITRVFIFAKATIGQANSFANILSAK